MAGMVHCGLTNPGPGSDSCARRWQSLNQGMGGEMGLWGVPSPPKFAHSGAPQGAPPLISFKVQLKYHTLRAALTSSLCLLSTLSHPPKQEVIFLLGILCTVSLYLVVAHINFSFLSELSASVSYIMSKLESFLMTGVIPHLPLWLYCTQPSECRWNE